MHAAHGLNRYPDRDALELRRALAGYISRQAGVPVEMRQVWAANGSNEVLQQLLQAFGGPGRKALGFEPSYAMHRLISRGTSTTFVAASRGSRFSLTSDLVRSSIDTHDPDVVFLCSPNNPTGHVASTEVIDAAYRGEPWHGRRR